MDFKRIREWEDIVFELKAWDKDGGKIEQWKIMKQDFPRVIKLIAKKYGFRIYVKEGQCSSDLDWAI